MKDVDTTEASILDGPKYVCDEFRNTTLLDCRPWVESGGAVFSLEEGRVELLIGAKRTLLAEILFA